MISTGKKIGPEWTVRRATLEDADEVFRLVEEYYEAVAVIARDSRGVLKKDYLDSPAAGVWLACAGPEAVGCILYHPLPALGAAGEVKRLYVRPPFRRRGVADALLDALEAFALRRGDAWLYLDTHAGLTAAIAFYARRGYVACPRYNDNPQATLFMRRRLSASF